MKEALKGVRILDLSRVLAGPWASQMLADMGADVIKVERPGGGDETREWGPPWHGQDADRVSAYFLSCNRGKRSIAVDFSHPEGANIVRQLALESDIVLENFRPGKLARHGLDHESLRQAHPGLIYCSITGFGQTGPYRNRAGYDLLIQAMGGLMSVTGMPDDVGGEPVKAGVALTDIMTGLYASNACMAALIERGRTGRGQYVDLALLDVQVAAMANQAMNYLVSGDSPSRLGSAHPNIVPYQAFPASDGYFIVAVGNDAQFVRLCQAIGQPEMADLPEYASNARRVQHREALITFLRERFQQQPCAYWLETLEAASVPAGPVNNMEQVFSDPQVQARGLSQSLPGKHGQPIPTVLNPMQREVPQNSAPSKLGAHTQEVLSQQLGMSVAEIEQLKVAGVIQLEASGSQG